MLPSASSRHPRAMQSGRHAPRQPHGGERLSPEISGIQNDEQAGRIVRIVREREDESVFLPLAPRICDKNRLAYSHAGRKKMNLLGSVGQIVPGKRFKRAQLRLLIRSWVTKPHITE